MPKYFRVTDAAVIEFRNANPRSRAQRAVVVQSNPRTMTARCTFCREVLATTITSRPSNAFHAVCEAGCDCADRAAYECIARRGLQLPSARVCLAIAPALVSVIAAVLAILTAAVGV